MPRRYEFDLDGEAAWVEIPDRWLGLHAERREQAAEKAKDGGLVGLLAQFAQAMALLDDWSVPGLTGNPEKWDFHALDLRILPWVVEVALTDFYRCFQVPKNSLEPSPAGLRAAAQTAQAPGSSEMSE